MGTFMRKFRRFILKEQLKRCRLRELELKERSERFHELIMDEIIKGKNNKTVIERWNIERYLVMNEIMFTIQEQFRLQNELLGA